MIIELIGVKKCFGAHQALDGLDMHIPSGAVYGLVGPNGAGKTTAIRHITGILRADSGQVLADGEPVFENTAVKARMAYIPDEVFYFPQANVNDMMRFYKSVFPSFDAERFERLAEAFPIDRKMPIRRFSRGMKKQAAFWLALSMRPELLVLDEPESNLDFKNQLIILDTIRKLSRERNISAIVNTHYPAHALQLSDKALMLNRDGSSFYGEAGEIINEKNMKTAFGVNVHVEKLSLNDMIYRSVIPLSLA